MDTDLASITKTLISNKKHTKDVRILLSAETNKYNIDRSDDQWSLATETNFEIVALKSIYQHQMIGILLSGSFLIFSQGYPHSVWVETKTTIEMLSIDPGEGAGWIQVCWLSSGELQIRPNWEDQNASLLGWNQT